MENENEYGNWRSPKNGAYLNYPVLMSGGLRITSEKGLPLVFVLKRNGVVYEEFTYDVPPSTNSFNFTTTKLRLGPAGLVAHFLPVSSEYFLPELTDLYVLTPPEEKA
jgi:hypothetical protein